MVQPVGKPTEACLGSPSRSSSHCPATCSATAMAGDRLYRLAVWSQADTSQSVAMATGRVPPVTYPKKRGPEAVGMPPSATARPNSSMVSEPGSDSVGMGPPNSFINWSVPAVAPTGRVLSPER